MGRGAVAIVWIRCQFGKQGGCPCDGLPVGKAARGLRMPRSVCSSAGEGRTLTTSANDERSLLAASRRARAFAPQPGLSFWFARSRQSIPAGWPLRSRRVVMASPVQLQGSVEPPAPSVPLSRRLSVASFASGANPARRPDRDRAAASRRLGRPSDALDSGLQGACRRGARAQPGTA